MRHPIGIGGRALIEVVKVIDAVGSRDKPGVPVQVGEGPGDGLLPSILKMARMGGLVNHHPGVKTAAPALHRIFQGPEVNAPAVAELDHWARLGGSLADDLGVLEGDILIDASEVAVIGGVPGAGQAHPSAPIAPAQSPARLVENHILEQVGLAEAATHAGHVALARAAQ